MATKTIQTRIKNRFDTLANWQGTGVTLLPGEIALVSVTTQQIDKDTGDVVNVPAVLMKVGESDGNGGSKSFDSLPWVSALAADVYDWAKEADAGNVVVKYNKGTETAPSWQSTTLLDLFKDLEAAEAEIAALKTGKLADISVSTDGTTGVVKAVEKNGTGGIKVTNRLVATADIEDSAVTTAKIKDSNVTTDKIADSAITNDKVAEGLSSDKINVTLDGTAETLTARIGDINTQIASINSSIANGVNFLGVTSTNVSDTSNNANKKVTIDSKNVDAEKGDIVIYAATGREFVWDGSKWEELGDATRVGALETLAGGLVETAATANNFVTHISKSSDGKTFVVNKAQPTSADIKHGTNSTVNEKLGDIDTQLANKSAKEHTHGNLTKDGELATANAVVVTDANKRIIASTSITTTELGHLDGITSNIQEQLNNKAASEHGTHVTYGGNGSASTVSRSDHTHDAYETNIAAIEGNYVKFIPDASDNTRGKLYVGKSDTTNVIIFDCGGAADL